MKSLLKQCKESRITSFSGATESEENKNLTQTVTIFAPFSSREKNKHQHESKFYFILMRAGTYSGQTEDSRNAKMKSERQKKQTSHSILSRIHILIQISAKLTADLNIKNRENRDAATFQTRVR